VATGRLAGKLISYSEYESPLSPRMKSETTKTEWGVPFTGVFGQDMITLFNENRRIRSPELRAQIKQAILALSDQPLKDILSTRELAPGIRRAEGVNNRHDSMKQAAAAGRGYGQGDRSLEHFQLDVCLQPFAAFSVNGVWPSVPLVAGEFFVTYFLSEEEQTTVTKHETTDESVYTPA